MKKAAGSKELLSGDETMTLHWSADMNGMFWVMPTIIVALVTLCARSVWRMDAPD